MSLLPTWEGRAVLEWRELWGIPHLEIHDRLPSTNDRAAELLADGAKAFTTVLAEEQTAGRGRQGSTWHSPKGTGLLLSTVVAQEGPVPLALPLVVALATAHAMERAAPGVEVGLKWPNDLLIGGRKVGGILCESKVGSGPWAVVVGIGLNVLSPAGGIPDDVAGTAVSLEEAAASPVSRSDLATRLMEALRPALSLSVGGLSPTQRADFSRRDVLAGREVVTAKGEGTAEGVDDFGGLVLRLPDGSETTVVAGSVRLVQPRT